MASRKPDDKIAKDTGAASGGPMYQQLRKLINIVVSIYTSQLDLTMFRVG